MNNYSGLVLDGPMTGQQLANTAPIVNVHASQDDTSFTSEILVHVIVPGCSALTGVWLRPKNRAAFLSDQTAYLARRLVDVAKEYGVATEMFTEMLDRGPRTPA